MLLTRQPDRRFVFYQIVVARKALGIFFFSWKWLLRVCTMHFLSYTLTTNKNKWHGYHWAYLGVILGNLINLKMEEKYWKFCHILNIIDNLLSLYLHNKMYFCIYILYTMYARKKNINLDNYAFLSHHASGTSTILVLLHSFNLWIHPSLLGGLQRLMGNLYILSWHACLQKDSRLSS